MRPYQPYHPLSPINLTMVAEQKKESGANWPLIPYFFSLFLEIISPRKSVTRQRKMQLIPAKKKEIKTELEELETLAT